MDVTRTAERDLAADQQADVRALQQLAFPSAPEFATQRWWNTPLDPDEQWLAAWDDAGKLIGSVRLIFRNITTAAGELRVGGIGNVCSHPDARGQGAAKACMQAAAEVIATDADFGLLMTGDGVWPFYEKLGWRVVDNHVTHRQADGTDGPGHNGPDDYKMILPGKRPLADWPAGPINFNGPDW